jgi:hypothetical protein
LKRDEEVDDCLLLSINLGKARSQLGIGRNEVVLRFLRNFSGGF